MQENYSAASEVLWRSGRISIIRIMSLGSYGSKRLTV